jgi:hypothetical protein
MERDSKQQDQINKATKESDPTTYSILPSGEKRNKIFQNPFVKRKIPMKTDGEENYFELDNSGHHSPKGQQAVSRILKGILNVSDIISEIDSKGVKKYYSLEIPSKKIKQESTLELVQADQILLGYVFGSNDHLSTYSGWMNNASYKDSKVAHFDFGEDAYDFLREPSNKDSLTSQIKQMKPGTLLYLKEKVMMLEARFKGSEGRLFFGDIIKSTREDVVELFGPKKFFEYNQHTKPEDLVYQTLMERIENLLALISSLENNTKVS